MTTITPMDNYDSLFPTEKSKADAFDKIAERFYNKNFGTMSKSDIETLMFSIYIERILDNNDKDFSAYSDYKLAKDLGITQSKVSNLKIRKQLQYPREYDWRSAFASISDHATYEHGKIIIQIPDINLYYEIKNAIEERGGFVEVTLNRGMLVVPLTYFLDFMEVVADDKDRGQLHKAIQSEIQKCLRDQEIVEREPMWKKMKKFADTEIINIINNVITNPASLLCPSLTGIIAIAKSAFNII